MLRIPDTCQEKNKQKHKEAKQNTETKPRLKPPKKYVKNQTKIPKQTNKQKNGKVKEIMDGSAKLGDEWHWILKVLWET